MSDPLEDFFRHNREDFDFRKPSKSVWKRIRLNMGFRESTLQLKTVIYRAAAVVLILISSWLIIDKIQTNYRSVEAPDVSLNTSGLDEIEQFYLMSIEKKMSALNAFSKGHELIIAEFRNELNDLDSMYLVLKGDLRKGNDERVMDAMILNLQLRTEILSQQLDILNKLKKLEENEEFI